MNSDTINELSQLKADNALLSQALADCHLEIERLHKLKLNPELFKGWCPKCGLPTYCDCWSPNR